jgi:hypothetical protein
MPERPLAGPRVCDILARGRDGAIEAASSFDKLRMRVNFLEDATKIPSSC